MECDRVVAKSVACRSGPQLAVEARLEFEDESGRCHLERKDARAMIDGCRDTWKRHRRPTGLLIGVWNEPGGGVGECNHHLQRPHNFTSADPALSALHH